MDKDAILGGIKAFPFAVLCGAFSLACLVLLFLRGGVADELAATELELLGQIRLIDANVKNSKSLEEDVSRLEKLVASIEERLFERRERAVNTNFFYAFEDRFNVVFEGIMQLDEGDPIYANKGPRKLDKYETLVYKLTLSGRFGDVVSCIEALSLVDPLIRVADYRLMDVKTAESAGLVQAELRVIVMAEKGS